MFYVAYDDGSYSVASRSTLAIAVWWVVLIGLGVGPWPLAAITRAALVPAALLAAYGLWQLASVTWAADADAAFVEFDRTMLYLGVYLLVVLATRRRHLARWLNALWAAIAATTVVSLGSHFFPSAFPARGLTQAIPGAVARLSFPLDYWNGLALFIALGVPLLLASAATLAGLQRAALVGTLPAAGLAIYLTSSRGAALAVVVGLAVLVASTRNRGAVVGMAVVAASGAVAAVTAVGTHRGAGAALLTLGTCLVTAAAYELCSRALSRIPLPRVPAPRFATAAVGALLLAVVVAGGIKSHPIARFQAFKSVPASPPAAGAGSVQTHLLSDSGSGRWQLWQSAVQEFESSPGHGRGAGSFETWWSQHSRISYPVRDAHSLYLQTLGELGIVGLLLIVGVIGGALAIGVRRVRAATGAERTLTAGVLAAVVVYAVGAAIDWMWQLPAMTVMAVCGLALLAGPATAPGTGLRAVAADEARHLERHRFALATAVIVAAWLVICAQAIPLLAGIQVQESQAAASRGDGIAASSHAAAATKLEPWAATPYLQLALVYEERGALGAAREAIAKAAARSGNDWRLWLVSARIAAKSGARATAQRDLARARVLNPYSPLWSTR